MFSLLLAVIYLSFISLGLPDTLLGAGWPVMQGVFNVPLSYMGIITVIISLGTVISSLFTDKAVSRLGTGLTTAISVGMTALALLGFALANRFWMLCLLAVPYGLGAGAVDAALNNYVALHYASRHMNWLHACWGVGATISPNIMGFALAKGMGYRAGYGFVSVIQCALCIALFCTLFLWKRPTGENEVETKTLSLSQAVRIPGVPWVILAFFAYCAVECTASSWAATYYVNSCGFGAEIAASLASFGCLGITVGRIISGFVSDKLGDRNMIRMGSAVMLFGALIVAASPLYTYLAPVGLLLAGLGCAPVYPAIIHSTPFNFGKENSQSLVGIQMASAYMGIVLMPALFGVLAEVISLALYPWYLAGLTVLLFVASERLNRAVDRNRAQKIASERKE
ncbi:MAG: MFS transporter [Clostridia bacterium]|nr:MFS transporter [Clostridia bacterium]